MKAAILGSFAVVLALSSASGVARAHTLDLGTARLSLRDEHVEVVAEVDLFLLSDATPTALATASDAEVVAQSGRLAQAMETGTRLEVDGVRLPLRVRGMPSPPELRALAATLSAGQKDHGTLVPIRFEATGSVHEPKAMSLALPASLGPVLVTMVQPATHYAAPGVPASFAVLGPQSSAPPSSSSPMVREEPSRERASIWFWGITGIALLGGAIVYGLRFGNKYGKVVS